MGGSFALNGLNLAAASKGRAAQSTKQMTAICDTARLERRRVKVVEQSTGMLGLSQRKKCYSETGEMIPCRVKTLRLGGSIASRRESQAVEPNRPAFLTSLQEEVPRRAR